MKSGTQMPRGMLRGCQRRASNLESHTIGITIIVAAYYAAKTFLASIFVYSTDFRRKKEWWENISR